MIEWIPIKDFITVPDEEVLVCEQIKGKLYIDVVILDGYECYNGNITHVARINRPEVKTLYKKFEERGKGIDAFMLEDLVKIAKEHYDGDDK